MRVAIDASNIRAGGGITHLAGLLEAVMPERHGISGITVWASSHTLDQLPTRPWLEREHHGYLDRSLPFRLLWQRLVLERRIRAGFDCLFVPGGAYSGQFAPVVAMSQNLLPFDLEAQARYPFGWKRARLALLKRAQRNTFSRAAGVIFLTPYARQMVLKNSSIELDQTRIIPHGISARFSAPPRVQLRAEQFSSERPFRLLYVSSVERYKHQAEVVEATAKLRNEGMPITLDLVGPAEDNESERKMWAAIRRADPSGHAIRYVGKVPFNVLPTQYQNADAFVFASSCETFGQILLEAMASGLPIACSSRSSLPDVLGEAGTYFDPERPAEIAAAISLLFSSPELRATVAEDAFRRSQGYSWSRCAAETFDFLAEVSKRYEIDT